MSETVKLFIHGASAGNPGASASSYILVAGNDSVLAASTSRIPCATIAEAEYKALVAGLYRALSHGSGTIEVFTLSATLLGHLTKGYKVALHLQKFNEAVRLHASHFKHVEYLLVDRTNYHYLHARAAANSVLIAVESLDAGR